MSAYDIGIPHLRDAPSSPCAACGIRAMSVCSVLDPVELDELAAITQDFTLDSGEALFSEGDRAEHLYNVTSGWVKLYKLLPDGRRQITGFLFAGDFLGLAVSDTYAYTAEAITGIAVCRFPRRKLEAMLERFPHLQRRLFSMASNELAAAQEQMLLLGRKTAREKICSFLISLSQRAKQRGHAENPVHVPMSRSDIGDFLGLTMETVSRTFTQLKTNGAIRLLDGHQVQLVKPESLIEMAENG